MVGNKHPGATHDLANHDGWVSVRLEDMELAPQDPPRSGFVGFVHEG